MRFISKLVSVKTFITVIAIVLVVVLVASLLPLNIKEVKQTPVISKSVCDEVLKQKGATPVTKFEGKPAKINFSSYPEAKTFYTEITRQAAEGPNFAGHFTYAGWGCGTNCLGYAVVDSITGNIISYERGGVIFGGYPTYDIGSRLLVFNPKEFFEPSKEIKLEDALKEGYSFYPTMTRDYYELIEDGSGSPWLSMLCTENVLDGTFSQ